MGRRNERLQTFFDSAEAAILARTSPDDPARLTAGRVFSALKTPGGGAAGAPTRLPVCGQFATAVASVTATPSLAAAHAHALAAIEPQLTWVQSTRASPDGERFKSNHANAMIVGPGGLETRTDVWVGVSLLAPGTTYPDHSHPPEEVYLALSPGHWRQAQGAWHEPGPGNVVYNPPGIVHAMRASSVPLLATWLLWIGP